MSTRCRDCGRTKLDLDRGRVRRLARLVYDTLQTLGGTVPTQQELLDHLWGHHRISHATGQRYVDGLAELGYLSVEYYIQGTRKKRVTAVERP